MVFFLSFSLSFNSPSQSLKAFVKRKLAMQRISIKILILRIYGININK